MNKTERIKSTNFSIEKRWNVKRVQNNHTIWDEYETYTEVIIHIINSSAIFIAFFFSGCFLHSFCVVIYIYTNCWCCFCIQIYKSFVIALIHALSLTKLHSVFIVTERRRINGSRRYIQIKTHQKKTTTLCFEWMSVCVHPVKCVENCEEQTATKTTNRKTIWPFEFSLWNKSLELCVW